MRYNCYRCAKIYRTLEIKRWTSTSSPAPTQRVSSIRSLLTDREWHSSCRHRDTVTRCAIYYTTACMKLRCTTVKHEWHDTCTHLQCFYSHDCLCGKVSLSDNISSFRYSYKKKRFILSDWLGVICSLLPPLLHLSYHLQSFPLIPPSLLTQPKTLSTFLFILLHMLFFS